MSTRVGASAVIDPNDPVFQYLTGSPPPRSTIDQSDVSKALVQLEAGARLATAGDSDGKRWVPGLSVVAVAREGGNKPRVLYCAGHGTRSVDGTAPVGPDTLFPCASLSKPVSTTLLTVAGIREPAWEKAVKQPDGSDDYRFANSSKPPPTLRQWLSHRSGLPDHGGDLIEDMNPAMTRHDLIGRVLKYQTDIEPERFRYTNFGFTIGCVGAARALGNPVWEAFAAEGLSRLGMSRSTYEFTSAFADDTADRVLPHQGKPEPPELLSLQPTGWTWHVVEQAHERNPKRQAPAGSLLSSARDLGQFLSAHLSRQFGDFPPRKPPPADTDGRPYSLGWNVANHSHDAAFRRFGPDALNAISFSHSGAFSLGAGTFLRFDPDAGFGIAILSNGEPTGVPEALAELFFKYLYGQPMPAGCTHATLLAIGRKLMMNSLYEQKIANYARYHEKTVAIPDSLPLGEIFRGHSNYYDCDIVIEHRGRDLLLTMGKGPQGSAFWCFPLQCVDAEGETFVYATTGENEVGLSAIRLTWEGGVVVKIVDDWLNGVGPGESGTGLGEIERSR